MKCNRVLMLLLMVTALWHCAPLVNRIAFDPDRRDYGRQLLKELGGRPVRLHQADGVVLDGCYLPNPESRVLFLYFRGQGGNYSRYLEELAQWRGMGAGVFTFDYRGYGRSSGSPSESACYADADLAFTYAVDSLGFRPGDIVVVGRSLGTAFATFVSQNREIRGLVLIQPLTNASMYARYHAPDFTAWFVGDAFDNTGRMSNIVAPLVVIHGTEDSVIPVHMGIEIYQACRSPKSLITVQGADHEGLDPLGSPEARDAVAGLTGP